ncbi:MAG: uracil-DNA glycosylase [Nevskiaceae bacterium]
MDPARRLRYLHALGIEPWELRGAAPRTVPAPIEVREAAPATLSAPVPADWEGLQAAVAACRQCRLCETRTNTVFGVGPRNAPLMVVGEGPGADEDAKGEPFVGRAGRLLDEMLRAIGRSRGTDTFIANVVKCRPPGNREPAEDEAARCRPFLEQQLRLVRPKLIVALGRVAAQRLLVTDTPIGKMRGQTYRWGPDETPLMVTYHPAYLLRNPADKAKSWEDLKRFHRFLAGA